MNKSVLITILMLTILSACSRHHSAPEGTGTASLSWAAPTTNTDASPLSLSDLLGYRVYVGDSPGTLTLATTINDASITTYEFTKLPVSTYYFAVTAVNTDGIESTFSTIESKTIN